MAAIKDEILKPIDGESTMGMTINHELGFDEIKREMGKLSGTDYALVEKRCVELLTGKSKDIRLIAFLGLAYLRGERWEDLCGLFEAFATMAETDYGRMFPEREHGRQLAIQWLSEQRFTDALADKKPVAADYPYVAGLQQSLEKLKPVFERNHPGIEVFPTKWYAAVCQWEKESAPKPLEQDTAQQPAFGQAAPAQEQWTTTKQALQAIRKAALFLVTAEPSKASGYRHLFASRWDTLETLPPSENGITRIEGPTADQRNAVAALLKGEDRKALVVKVLQLLCAGSGHLWLDLPRLCIEGLKGMGEGNADAIAAIEDETGRLIKRLPGLTGLAFTDKTPLCDQASRAWIDALGAKTSGRAAAPQSRGPAIPDEDPAEKEIADLLEHVKYEEAIGAIHRAITTAATERKRFARSILLGTCLLSAQKPDIAVAVLEQLAACIDDCCVDRWDPELAAEALVALVKAYRGALAKKSQQQQAGYHEKIMNAVARLSRIQPRAACALV